MEQGFEDLPDSDDISLTNEEREELEDTQPLSSPISFRNQDFDAAGLVKRLENRDILVPRIGSPSEVSELFEMNSFQRGFVWSRKQMDSFIESLLLEYPIRGCGSPLGPPRRRSRAVFCGP